MIKIKDWSSYQSYKDRKPPWIRFHKSILDDYDFQSMSANARALLPMLWLLASEYRDPSAGLISDSMEKISFRLRISMDDLKSGLEEISSSGFIQLNQSCNESVTKPLQKRNETVTPETETEAETKTEAKKNLGFKPSGVSDEVWADFITQRKAKNAKVTETVIKRIESEAKKANWTTEEALSEICLRNWQGFKADWVTHKKKANANFELQKKLMGIEE